MFFSPFKSGRTAHPNVAKPKPAVAQCQITLADGRDITLELRKKRGMKRLVLRFDRTKGIVVASGPPSASQRALRDLALANLDWISQQIARAPQSATPLADGDLISLRGRPTIVQRKPGRGGFTLASGSPDVLTICASEAGLRAALRRTLQALAHSEALAHFAELKAISGLAPSAIAMRDTKSRWGSCTSDGRIMLSWRLIGAEPEIFRYVVAHELAHLKEMNHGPRFWALVETMVPDWKPKRDWLRKHGASLHSLGV